MIKKRQKNLKRKFCKAGGTASKNAVSPKLNIPMAWLKEMGINPEDKEITLTFDGKKIIIEKKNIQL